MQTIKYRINFRIWEVKEDKYAKSPAKNQDCVTCHMQDILKRGLPKFTKICMEMPCWCPFEGHKIIWWPGNQQKHLSLSFRTKA